MNKNKMFVLMLMLFAAIGLACQKTPETNSANQAKTNSKANEPAAIEITAEALSKEWLANPAESDKKYMGKTLSVTGEVYSAVKIGDQYIVDFLGIIFDEKTRGAKVSCVSDGKEDDARLIVGAQESNEKMLRENPGAKMPKTKATAKGTYSRSAPPNDTAMAFMDLNPCKVLMVLKN